MKLRKLEIVLDADAKGHRLTPLHHEHEAGRPLLAWLYFSADSSADKVSVFARHDKYYRQDEDFEATGSPLIRVPIPTNVTRHWLRLIPHNDNMIMLINGMIDGEVLVDYAKYAIEYVATTREV